jgi:hypothetical protein
MSAAIKDTAPRDDIDDLIVGMMRDGLIEFLADANGDGFLVVTDKGRAELARARGAALLAELQRPPILS